MQPDQRVEGSMIPAGGGQPLPVRLRISDHRIDHRQSRGIQPGARHGQGRCTILWIKVSDDGWVLLPHGMPNLAIHLSTGELTTLLSRLREKLVTRNLS